MTQPPPPPPQQQHQISPFGLHGVEDLNFLPNDHGDLVPISDDDEYAEELQFQEFLSSLITSQNTIKGSSSSSSKAVGFTLVPITKQIDYVDGDKGEEEPGESSFSSHVICEICAETRECEQMFRNRGCDHSFCSECVTKQVATKVEEGITVVACPGLNCKGVLELDACRPMLPKELLDNWDKALCEALFLGAPKLYCPFRDCSAMLLNDDEGENIGEAECPSCHRLFCARCNVPWHPGVECEVFQSLNEDERGREDLLVRELASEKKWKRCPRCKFYVEKTQGCLHILCRCRFEFCYACGEQWTTTHGGCQRD